MLHEFITLNRDEIIAVAGRRLRRDRFPAFDE